MENIKNSFEVFICREKWKRMLFLALSVFVLESKAQESQNNISNRQQIYLETLGPGAVAVTLNYDMRFKPQPNGFGFRAGIGLMPSSNNSKFSIPIQLNYLVGKKHQFEGGIGASYYYSQNSGSDWNIDSTPGGTVFATFSAGYRYQPSKKGFTVRVGASFLYGDFLPILTPQLSIGYLF